MNKGIFYFVSNKKLRFVLFFYQGEQQKSRFRRSGIESSRKGDFNAQFPRRNQARPSAGSVKPFFCLGENLVPAVVEVEEFPVNRADATCLPNAPAGSGKFQLPRILRRNPNHLPPVLDEVWYGGLSAGDLTKLFVFGTNKICRIFSF